MASNVVSINNVYQLNGDPPFASAVTIAFPATNCLLRDISASPNRLLSTGVSVYSAIQYQNQLYYTSSAIATLVSAFNA